MENSNLEFIIINSYYVTCNMTNLLKIDTSANKTGNISPFQSRKILVLIIVNEMSLKF
jgi:hypothetical protein